MAFDKFLAFGNWNACCFEDEFVAVLVLSDSLCNVVGTKTREAEKVTKCAELSQSGQTEHVRDDNIRGHLAELLNT